MPSRCTASSEKQRQRHKGLSALTVERTKLMLVLLSLPFLSQQNCVGHRNMQRCEETGNSLLIYKSELAVDCTAGDELRGSDADVFGGLVGGVGVQAAHGHQATHAGGFLVDGVALWVQLAARPAAHVSGAVQRAVSVTVWRRKKDRFTSEEGFIPIDLPIIKAMNPLAFKICFYFVS